MNEKLVSKAADSLAAAVIVAAGSGSRMKSDVKKQFMDLCGKPVLFHALDTFSRSAVIDEIILVVSEEDMDYCRREIIERFNMTKVKRVVTGGAERYLSVWNGIRAVSGDIEYVMIHDAARPLISTDVIYNAYERLKETNACVVGVPAKDTIKQTDDMGKVVATPDRSTLWTVQTPQCFRKALLLNAYKALWEDDNNTALTDDAMIVEHYTDTKVYMLKGEYSNIKITTPEDMIMAEALLEKETIAAGKI